MDSPNRPRRRKLLVATIGVATVSYVVLANIDCGGQTDGGPDQQHADGGRPPTAANLPAPPPTAANLPAPPPTAANLPAPPAFEAGVDADVGDSGDGG
jgi:hypothetical protein